MSDVLKWSCLFSQLWAWIFRWERNSFSCWTRQAKKYTKIIFILDRQWWRIGNVLYILCSPGLCIRYHIGFVIHYIFVEGKDSLGLRTVCFKILVFLLLFIIWTAHFIYLTPSPPSLARRWMLKEAEVGACVFIWQFGCILVLLFYLDFIHKYFISVSAKAKCF